MKLILMDCRHCGDMAVVPSDEVDAAYCSPACRRADQRAAGSGDDE